MKQSIKELRKKTKMTQKAFAEKFDIPLSTLRKWEQGESNPPGYLITLISNALPSSDDNLKTIELSDGRNVYYDKDNKTVRDELGNTIKTAGMVDEVKEQNLTIYLEDLFDELDSIRDRFERDCKHDLEEDILWER